MKFKENALTYEIYYKLRESVGWNNFSPSQTEKALVCSAYDVVVEENEKIIGMARLVGDGLYYIIVDVIVIPEMQGQGIGTKMINLVMEHIENEMPEGARVSIQLISEKGKEKFYCDLGFKQLPHEYCGAGMRKVLLKRE